MWRGTGRRRLPDALQRLREDNQALRAQVQVRDAAIDTYRREATEDRARIKGLEETVTWQAVNLEHAREEAAQARTALADAEKRHAQEVAQLKAQHQAERAELVAYRADACNRGAITLPRLGEVAVSQDLVRTAPAGTDVSELRAKHAGRPVPTVAVADLGNEAGGGVAEEGNTDAPTVAVPVAVDDDTLTLPVQAAPPRVEVHEAPTTVMPAVSPIGLVVPIPPAKTSEPGDVPRLVEWGAHMATVRHLSTKTPGGAA
jgi:multidrug efflux pump subunit AcrA (membrane-fusion protein)